MRTNRLAYFFGLFLLISLFINLTPVTGLAASPLDTARSHLEMGMPQRAYEVLDRYLDTSAGAKSLEAHYLLGLCYLQKGQDNAAAERFSKVMQKTSRYNSDIGKKYYEYAKAAKQAGNTASAQTRFQNALNLNSSLKNKASTFYRELGDSSRGQTAERLYDLALRYAQTDQQKRTIAKAYLRLAVQGYNCANCKQKAANIIGADFVEKVFPSSKKFVVFEKNFSDKDIDPKRGNIIAFTWSNNFRKDDNIEIVGQIPNGAPEIAVFMGKEFTPKWEKTKNGYMSYPIEKIPDPGLYYLVWIEKNKNINFTLKVTRTINPKPNLELLASL